MWAWYEVLQVVGLAVLFVAVVMEGRQAFWEGWRE